MLCSNPLITRADFPPVYITGNLSTTYIDHSIENGSSRNQSWLSMATIDARSYIWQPWFALVNGSLSLASSRSNASGQSSSKSQFISGDLKLSLFPSSRFPLLIYASRNRSDTDQLLTDNSSTSTRIGLSQQYRSIDGKQSYSGKFERNQSASTAGERSINDSLDIDGNLRFEENTWRGNISYSNNTVKGRGDATTYAITGSHSNTAKKNLTLQNMLASTQVHSDFNTYNSDTRNNQVGSFASWTPTDHPDIRVTGNIRASNLDQSFIQSDTTLATNIINRSEQSIININQGLVYSYSPRVSFSESINASLISNGSINHVMNASESVGAGYSSDTLTTSYGNYNWNIGTSAGYNHGDGITSESSLNSRLGHSLATVLQWSPTVAIRSRFNQSMSHGVRSSSDSSTDFRHSMTLSWMESSDFASTSVRLQLSDARTYSQDDTRYQLFNLQFTSENRQSRSKQVLAQLTIQQSLYSTEKGTGSSQLINGQIDFVNSRFLNRHNLQFKSSLRSSYKQSGSKEDSLTADDSTAGNSWDNEWYYRIGLLDARINLNFPRISGTYDRVLKIQLTRRFGAN